MPCSGDGLEFLCREVPSIVLTTFVVLYNLLGVGDSSRPIEALVVGFTDQRSRGRMVATYSLLDVVEEGFALVGQTNRARHQ
jgi:hypothetical protein